MPPLSNGDTDNDLSHPILKPGSNVRSAGFFMQLKTMTHPNSYDDCLEAMYGLRRFGIKLGLGTIQRILDGLGNPQERFACIHIAGTNGKGSIASSLSSILQACGYKTGLYTSPHLIKFNERICIDNRPISDRRVVEAYEAVKNVPPGDREPTFFEYSTAMALYAFGQQGVEWAVIETGMGGRLDATNIIQPRLSIISNISLEHQMYLGNTIAQIAFEKGGIIKEQTPVITGAEQKNAIAVLSEIAQKQSAPLYRFKEAFRVRRNRKNTFTYFGIDHRWPHMQTPLRGRHQIDNLAMVLAACEILMRNKVALPIKRIQSGIAQNRWPGRLDIVSVSPLLILDGAHNLTAAKNLSHFLASDIKDRHLTLVVGILDDKPYAAMLKYLLPFCNRVILTRARIDRALDPRILFEIAQEMVADVRIIADVADAVKWALKSASPRDAICVAGSLYVVGEAKEALENKT